MSPISFFRKKRTRPDETPAPSPESPAEPVDASRQPWRTPASEPNLDLDLTDDRDRSDEDAEAAYAAVTEAFAAWRASLAGQSHDIILSADEPDVVDFAHIHPTGAAGFYGGSPTPLTSLFR